MWSVPARGDPAMEARPWNSISKPKDDVSLSSPIRSTKTIDLRDRNAAGETKTMIGCEK